MIDQPFDKIKSIEAKLGYDLPDEYKTFLLDISHTNLTHKQYCRILDDGYRVGSVIDEFVTFDNFWEYNEFRDYLFDLIDHFELSKEYVEAENLYHIAMGPVGAICMAMKGNHKGKIYSVDNGDFGVIYQSHNLKSFLESLYNSDEFKSQYDDLLEAVNSKDLKNLKYLIEERDGGKLLERSSWIDINLFNLAYNTNQKDVLDYLLSKGFTGHR